MARLLPVGAVLGRFQPFHRDHMEYLLAALVRCSVVYVGLTRPGFEDPALSAGPAHRHDALANPLSYYERQEAVLLASKDGGIDTARVRVVPFPLDSGNAELCRNFLPVSVPVLLTCVEPWNVEKERVIRGMGYRTSVLYERVGSKGISGSQLRELACLGRLSEWRALVAPSVADYLVGIGFEERCRNAPGSGLSSAWRSGVE